MNFVDYLIATRNYSALSAVNEYTKTFGMSQRDEDALTAKLRIARKYADERGYGGLNDGNAGEQPYGTQRGTNGRMDGRSLSDQARNSYINEMVFYENRGDEAKRNQAERRLRRLYGGDGSAIFDRNVKLQKKIRITLIIKYIH